MNNKYLIGLCLTAVTGMSWADGHADTMSKSPRLAKGDIVLRAGVMTFNPSVDSEVPELNGVPIGPLANEIDVDNANAFGVSGTYMVTDKIGVELLVSTPFEHDIEVKGGALDGTALGTTTHIPPTLTLQFYPFGGSDAIIQPYVGAGVNYTLFYDNDLDQEIVTAVNTVTGTTASGDLDIEDSFGYAVQLGTDVYLTQNLLVNLSYTYADVVADAEVSFNDGNEITVEADLDPSIFRVTLGYNF